MKKYALYLLILIIPFTFIVNHFLNISDNTEDSPPPIIKTLEEPTPSIPVESEDTPQEEILYIARDLDGYVAIFVPNDTLPYIVTDIYTKILPIQDQESLKDGIIINKDYTLAMFIEDFDAH